MERLGTILIVDDDPMIREVVGMTLEKLPYEILKFDGANSALEHCEFANGDVKLIVSDVRMPDGDGFHLLKNLKESSSKVPPVVVMTGYSEYTEEEMKGMGATYFLSKPAAPDMLLSIAYAALSMDESPVA